MAWTLGGVWQHDTATLLPLTCTTYECCRGSDQVDCGILVVAVAHPHLRCRHHPPLGRASCWAQSFTVLLELIGSPDALDHWEDAVKDTLRAHLREVQRRQPFIQVRFAEYGDGEWLHSDNEFMRDMVAFRPRLLEEVMRHGQEIWKLSMPELRAYDGNGLPYYRESFS